MAREANVNVTSERNPRKREPDDRAQPFLSVLLMALFGVPVLVIVLRFFLFISPHLMTLIVWLVLFLFGVLGPLVAIGVGYKVSKRIPFVVWHVAGTVEAFAVAVSIGVGLGWHRTGPHWWDRIGDVVLVPAAAGVIYLVCALFVALSWMLYRIDAFRAATGTDDGRGRGLADLLGFPVGATVRPGTIEADEYAVTAVIDHPTVPADKVQAALPALVEKAGAVRGRSTIIANERGGSSTVRIVKSDPMKDWRIWPGLSHPGLSFAYPFRTAYYSSGPTQWYSFAKTPKPSELPPSPVVPNFRSANDAHIGRQGATRAGKSGDIAIEQAEVLSRSDAVVCLINTAKLMQDSGWCLDMCELVADTKHRAQLLFAGVRQLGEYRSHIMGDPRLNGRHRRWTHATFEELGFPAVYVGVDEGDQVLNAADATWLATKGLSLGIYSSVAISRAVTDGMASTLRSAIPTWKAFGAGVDYDGGFALSESTLAAGADPAAFGTRFPGAHYLDKAQGVEETMFPVDARSFQTEEDFSDLRAAVRAVRATFDPATFTPGEISALAEAWTACQPRTVLLGAFDQADKAESAATGGNETPADQEGNSMTKTLNLNRFESGDPELDDLMNSPPENFDDYEREYGPLPPANEPIPAMSDPQSETELESTKPRVSPEQSVAEFDAALVRMADRGVREFSNREVIDEMRVAPHASWVSRRFTAICDEGEHVRHDPPPGLTIERVPGRVGRYVLTRVDGT
jgi:hypothetical protein